MKIKIITIHGIPNFGSVFQSYALCEFLKQNGYDDVEIIDYNPKYYKSHSLRAVVGRILNHRSYVRRTHKFRSFIEQYLPLTSDSFTNITQLSKYEFSADIYIAGGDQLWNVYHACGNDDVYKLTWAKGKKISYGTSMGQTGFSMDQLRDLAAKISDFSAVAVRESSSVNLLASVGVKAVHVVDPVFLLAKQQYMKFVRPVNQPKYMLVYLVTPSELLEETIKCLATRFGLKVILCSGFSKKCTCDEFLKDLGPDEILSYIYNAEIVLSSSFHATAFSILFEKQFLTILPDSHTNERILDLLSHFNLLNRVIQNLEQVSRFCDVSTNFTSSECYNLLLDSSKKYLLEALMDV